MPSFSKGERKMCLTRIYCVRRRDNVLFRFNSKATMVAYSRENHETPKTMPMIDRTEFIRRKNRYASPTWVRSTRHDGMAMLTEAR